jgi:hypothetical protein
MKRNRKSTLITGVPASIAVISAVVLTLVGSSGVTAATAVAPTNTAPPTISGTAEEGKTLTANKGTWSGTEPITYTYQWRRCDGDGGSCSSIGGATETTYVLKKVDVDNTLRVVVTAKNADGSVARTTVPTAVVRAAAVTLPPVVSDGCAKKGGTIPVAGVSPPARLTIDQTLVEPSTITYGTRSLTARFHVSACGGSVEGALVYVTAVPYGQFSIPNEQTTGSDGWATLQFTALAGYPVSTKQQLLVMFVRARKSGENVLGGISSRRLVSFRVTPG